MKMPKHVDVDKPTGVFKKKVKRHFKNLLKRETRKEVEEELTPDKTFDEELAEFYQNGPDRVRDYHRSFERPGNNG